MAGEYPQSEKLAEINEERVAINEFIEWLNNEKSISLVNEGTRSGIHQGVDSLVMEFYGIDEKELERERRKMLDEVIF
jgi:hypothetical protein